MSRNTSLEPFARNYILSTATQDPGQDVTLFLVSPGATPPGYEVPALPVLGSRRRGRTREDRR